MSEESEEASEANDYEGQFQDMMETSGLREGHEIEEYRKSKKEKKMLGRLKLSKGRFSEDQKHTKKKVKR
jgi:hypothetical protein